MKYPAVLDESLDTITATDITKETKFSARGYGPALESLYFRSFGSRPLLNKENEIELAKEIDHASRTIRLITKQLLHVANTLPKSLKKEETIAILKETFALNGLSAPAIEKLKNIILQFTQLLPSERPELESLFQQLHTAKQ